MLEELSELMDKLIDDHGAAAAAGIFRAALENLAAEAECGTVDAGTIVDFVRTAAREA